jgi:hypothetical protein
MGHRIDPQQRMVRAPAIAAWLAGMISQGLKFKLWFNVDRR